MVDFRALAFFFPSRFSSPFSPFDSVLTSENSTPFDCIQQNAYARPLYIFDLLLRVRSLVESGVFDLEKFVCHGIELLFLSKGLFTSFLDRAVL